MTRSRSSPPGGDAATTAPVELRIALRDIEPPIWRHVVVDPRISLGVLHHVIQVAMGWTNSHLHTFRVGDHTYSDPSFEIDDAGDAYEVPLATVLSRKGDRLFYEYDLGDGWEHDVELQGRSTLDLGGRIAVCVGGARACPPEDVGGAGGYDELLEVLADPGHEEHQDRREWIDALREELADLDPRFEGPYDPEEFDPRLANYMLRQLEYEDEDDEDWDLGEEEDEDLDQGPCD